MTTPPRIKLQDTYIGVFDMDNDGDTIAPIIVAVSSDRLPMTQENFDELTPAERDVPVFEICAVDFLRTKHGELTGKVNVFISNQAQIPEDAMDFEDYEEYQDESYEDEPDGELTNIMDTLKEAFISRITSKPQNIIEPNEPDDEPENYVFTLDNAFLLTMVSLHLTGEMYIALFDNEHKPRRKNAIIETSELQAMIQLPALKSEVSENIIRDIADIASERGMPTLHKIAPTDQVEEERAKRLRGSMFILLSEFMTGSLTALEQLKNLIPEIDDFEDRVVIAGGDFRKGDEDTDTTISIIDSLISKLSVSSIIPREMTPQQIINFKSDFRNFSNIMSTFNNEEDVEFANSMNMLSQELGFNDKTNIDGDNKDGVTVSSFVSSKISRGTLPEEIFLLGEELDFGLIYERDWSLIDSMASFMDEKGNQQGTLGECLIAGLIVSVIRAMRLAKINHAPNMLFLASMISDTAPAETYWQLGAFSHKLANGNTELFEKMITTLPQGVELSQFIMSSFLGVTLMAFAKSLTEEGWSDDVINIALSKTPLIIDFLKEIKSTEKETHASFLENNEDIEELSEHDLKVVNKQILTHSIQQSIFNLGQKDVTAKEISDELITAMLTVADINTGKKTDSSFNSDEWINTKAEYLSNFFQMNSMKFF